MPQTNNDDWSALVSHKCFVVTIAAQAGGVRWARERVLRNPTWKPPVPTWNTTQTQHREPSGARGPRRGQPPRTAPQRAHRQRLQAGRREDRFPATRWAAPALGPPWGQPQWTPPRPGPSYAVGMESSCSVCRVVINQRQSISANAVFVCFF